MPLLRTIAVPGTRPRRARRGRRRHVAGDVAAHAPGLPDVGALADVGGFPAVAVPAQAASADGDPLPPHARSWGPRRPR